MNAQLHSAHPFGRPGPAGPPPQARPHAPSRQPARPAHVRRFATGFLLVCLIAGAAWPFLPRRYEAVASIILRPSDEDGRLDRAQALRQPLDENAIQSEMDIIGSPAIAAAVIARHGLAADPEFGSDPDSVLTRVKDWVNERLPIYPDLVRNPHIGSESALRQRLQKHLNISRDRRSYTIKLGYWSSDPAKAAAMTQTLLDAYLDDQVDRKRRSTERETAWLTERVEVLRAKYEHSEQAARDFSVESNLTDGATQSSLEKQLAELSRDAAEAHRQVIGLTVQAGLQAGAQAIRTADAAPGDGATASMRGTRTASANARPMSAADEAAAWTAKEEALRKAMKTVRAELAERRQAQDKLEDLRREAAIDKEVLESAVARLKEQTSRLTSIRPDAEVLAGAEVPLRPLFPNPLLTFLATLVAACMAGAAMVGRPLVRGAHRLLSER